MTTSVLSVKQFSEMAGPNPNHIQKFAIETYPMILKIVSDKNLDQRIGELFLDSVFQKACIGCHLAKFYGCRPRKDNWIHYSQGVEKVFKILNLTYEQLNFLLWGCGAPEFPFSSDKWETSIIVVWNRLVKKTNLEIRSSWWSDTIPIPTFANGNLILENCEDTVKKQQSR